MNLNKRNETKTKNILTISSSIGFHTEGFLVFELEKSSLAFSDDQPANQTKNLNYVVASAKK